MMSNDVDRGRSWVVLAACAFNCAAAMGVGMNCGVYIAVIIDYYQSSRAVGYMVGAVSNGVLYSFGPVATVLIEKFNHRTVSIAGAYLAAIGLILSANVASIYCLYLTFSITAIGCCFMYQSSLVVVMFYFKKHRALATSLVHTGSALGVTLYPLLSQVIIERYTWKPSLYIVAGVVLNTTVGSLLISPVSATDSYSAEMDAAHDDKGDEAHDEETDEASEPLNNEDNTISHDKKAIISNTIDLDNFDSNLIITDEMNTVDEHKHEQEKKSSTFLCLDWSLLKNKKFLLLMLSAPLSLANSTPIFVMMPDLYNDGKISVTDQSVLFLILGWCNIFGRLLCGLLWMKLFSPLTVNFISLLIQGTVVLLYMMNTNFIFLIFANILYALAYGSQIACITLVTLEIIELQFLNRAMAFTMLLAGIGSLLTPPFLGAVYDATGSYTWPLLIMAICGILSSLVIIPITPLMDSIKRLTRSKKDDIIGDA